VASPERASRSPSLFYPRAAGARLVLDKLAATSPTAPNSPSGRQQIEAGRQQEAPFARARLAQLIESRAKERADALTEEQIAERGSP